MSFLPYFVLLFLLLLIRWVVQLWKLLYRKPNKLNRKHKLAPFFVLSFGLLFFLSSARVQNFYHQELLTSPASTHGIKVLFSNLYKGNLNFEAIKNQILTENPDVILFVEFSEAHKAGLQAFFDEHYPYMNTTTWSKIFVGSVVFSKYPIENLADDFEQGRRRYGYFKLEKNQIPYYFYLVHTASPVSLSFFLKRNAQLQQLQSEFLELHQPQRGVDAKVIMV